MKLKILWIGLALWGFSFISLIAQPRATIVSADGSINADTAICESGNSRLRILFEGQAPYGVVYKIKNLETGGERTFTELDQNIFENDLVNGVWTTNTVAIIDTSEIVLIEVFDNTIPSANWKYSPSDNGYGSLDVHGKMTINVDQMPTPDAGLFIPQCGYVAPLNATPGNANNVIYWTDVPGGRFNDLTIPNPIFIAEASGTYVLTLTEESGTCIATDNINVELWGSPESTISGNKIICSNDGNSHSIDISVSLKNGMAPYNYKITNGDISAQRTDIVGVDNINVGVSKASSFIVTELFDARGCPAPVDSMKGAAIVVDNKPSAFAGNDTTFCADQGVLRAVLDKGTGEWQAHPQVTFSDQNSPNATATATSYGTHTLQWKETNQGCSETGTVNVLFVDPPLLGVVQQDTSICNGSSAQLRVTTNSAHYPLWLNFEGAEGVFVSINGSYQEIPVQPGVSTLYQLTKLTDDAGCISDLDESFDVTVDFVPDPDAGLYESRCGNEIQLNARLDEAIEAGLWSSTYGTFSDPTSPTSTFSIDESYQDIQEIHTLQWRVENLNNLNCVATESVDVVLDKKPINVSAGNDSVIYLVDELTLSATVDKDMTGLWSSIGGVVGFSDASDPQADAFGFELGSNILKWTVENGTCEVVDSATVKFLDLKAPNGFSPNGDELNDVFRIGGADHLSNTKLNVLSVNGKLVYSKENFGQPDSDGNMGWDGTDLNGNELPNGTYYYIFTGVYEGEEITKKEYLIIKGR